LVQLLPGIGGKGSDKLWKLFYRQLEQIQPAPLAGPAVESVADASEGGPPGTPPTRRILGLALQTCAASVPRKAAVAWAQFVATMAQLEGTDARGNPSRMLRLVIEAGYEDYLEETYANYRTRLEDLQQLGVFAQQFPNVEEFLTQLALLSNVEAEDDSPASKDDEQLKLSTIHQAKGLEFDVVFVIMLCDGLFPSGRSLDFPDVLEEERRLLYVALTRARNELYLSYPLIRAGFGGMGDSMQRPSRFLQEIPKDQVEEWSLKPFHPYG
jgi:DNA helicase-2/ATP-dependent DNA helicase PcrA